MRARWAEEFHDELIGHEITTRNQLMLDQLLPGLKRTMPSSVHQDGGVKHATGIPSKSFGTWNTRTLRAAVKFQELTHETDRF